MSGRRSAESDILDYIRENVVNGKITKSLLEIAADVGYSNATVHRNLKRLESKGQVKIDRTDKTIFEPSTIIYQASDQEETVLEQGIRLAHELRRAATRMIQFLEANSIENDQWKEDAEKWQNFQSRILNVVNMESMQVVTLEQEQVH